LRTGKIRLIERCGRQEVQRLALLLLITYGVLVIETTDIEAREWVIALCREYIIAGFPLGLYLWPGLVAGLVCENIKVRFGVWFRAIVIIASVKIQKVVSVQVTRILITKVTVLVAGIILRQVKAQEITTTRPIVLVLILILPIIVLVSRIDIDSERIKRVPWLIVVILGIAIPRAEWVIITVALGIVSESILFIIVITTPKPAIIAIASRIAVGIA
jgi:hypothetical protein